MEPAKEVICQGFPAPSLNRQPRRELLPLAHRCLENPVIQVVLEAMGGFVVVLNRERQVLAANPGLLRVLGVSDEDLLVSLRVGEVLDCLHSGEGADGCGSSSSCPYCGAFLTMTAVLDSGQQSSGECQILTRHDGRIQALEFQVKVTPLVVGDSPLLVCVLQDISAVRRQAQLEQSFFHDMKNILQGLHGWTSLLGAQEGKVAQAIVTLSERLSQELTSQQLLSLGETGQLRPEIGTFPLAGLFNELETYCLGFPLAKERTLEVAPPGALLLRTDRTLLLRVLTNMVKNGLEAARPGAVVRLWCTLVDGCPEILVNNPGTMGEAVARQVFQRSFSTKAKRGRGLGTYSMKLFGETYLHGQVDFRQAEGEGITFFIRLPADALP